MIISISSCGITTEKTSKFLKNYLQPITQTSWSYIRDSGDSIDKVNRIKIILKDAILVTADLIRLYPCIPRVAELKAVKKTLDYRSLLIIYRKNRSIPTEKRLKIAEFLLKNNAL